MTGVPRAHLGAGDFFVCYVLRPASAPLGVRRAMLLPVTGIWNDVTPFPAAFLPTMRSALAALWKDVR